MSDRSPKVAPSLIQAIGSQLHGVDVDAGRAGDIAREVEGLVRGLEDVMPVPFFNEPDGFRAALWAMAGKRVGTNDGR